MKNLIKIIIIITLVFSPIIPARAEAVIDILDIKTEIQDEGKTAVISWTTNISTQGKVIFGFTKDNLNAYIEDAGSAKKSHVIELSNLQPQTDYYYQILAWNNSNKVYSFVNHFDTDDYDDTNAPIISGLRVPYATADMAVIIWETNEAADTRVEFDDQRTYLYKANSSSRVTKHQIILTNLRQETEYWVRVQSKDKDNNYSSKHSMRFYTNANTSARNEELELSNLRPSTESDSQISDDSVTVSFKTNHFAKGRISLAKTGSKSQSISLEYASEHRATFLDLDPNSEYTVSISLKDIFKKTLKKTITIKTGQVVVLGANATFAPLDMEQYTADCSTDIFKQNGYFGQYYNAVLDRRQVISASPDETGWYSSDKFVKAQIDNNLNFGKNFHALQGVNGQAIHFSAYWRAAMAVPEDGIYSYSIASDDDSWVVIDGVEQLHSQARQSNQSFQRDINLSKGLHLLEIYYIFRGRSTSNMNFTLDSRITVYSLPANCNVNDFGGSTKVGGGTVGGNCLQNGNAENVNENVKVLGAEYSRYTRISAVYKTPASPDIYVIMNGQAHYVSSPSSFIEYGLEWSDVQTISQEELAEYPRARLIKSADQAAIYYLYQRAENKWLKIALNSPTVFISYPNNYWGNVITVTEQDVDSYPDVKLVRAFNEKAVYYLENNAVKHFVSAEVFVRKGFNKYEVAEVSEAHLDSFLAGEALK